MSDKKAKCKCEKALEFAERVRQFEIDLYWKRSAYFWTFIALAFAGYGALQVNGERNCKQENLVFLLANVGFVASAAWFHVNRGSKYWQEYWETQVERVEDGATGPLYRVVIARILDKKPPRRERLKAWWWWHVDSLKRPCDSLKQWMTGAPRLLESRKCQVKSLSIPSVSKINQLGSLYVTIVWFILGWKACPWSKCYNDWFSYEAAFGLLTLMSLVGFCCCGKTKLGDYSYAEDCRKATPLGPCRHASDDCCQKTSIR